MQPVKPQMDVQSEKPAMKSSNKKSIGLNKNCETTMSHKKQKKCGYEDSESHIQRNSDKNCQENNVMWSVTNETDMGLPKPGSRRLCSDKKCQSTRCYRSPIRPMYDKHCQL